ncbi:MAG: D-alanyl-D-alanine endopeptidase [Nitrosomonadales bacterium]|nr:MAG: D-alanyl-D-alanine endopeptidase [Nitrosomonadales bacterium]
MKAKWFIACLLLSSSIAVAAPAHKKAGHHKTGKAKAVKISKAVKPVKIHATEDHRLQLGSAVAMIVDQQSGETLFSRNAASQAPIASITKLMTAMVVLDAGLSMDEPITITEADVDWLRNSGSRLRVGTTLTRGETLQLALMSSENRAAAALARTYPGGMAQFVAAMNRKAAELDMRQTHFVDSTGLHSENVSTAEDLVKMVRAGYHYERIRQMSTAEGYDVVNDNGHRTAYRNTNALVKSPSWDIGLSKTGFINEAGRCLVMQAQIASRPVIIVLLDSWGKYTRIADANRIKKWLESSRTALARLG